MYSPALYRNTILSVLFRAFWPSFVVDDDGGAPMPRLPGAAADDEDSDDEYERSGNGPVGAMPADNHPNFTFEQRVIHYLPRGKVGAETRKAFEACVLLQAGTLVSEQETTDKASKERIIFGNYISVLESFPPETYDTNYLSRCKTKLVGAQQDLR